MPKNTIISTFPLEEIRAFTLYPPPSCWHANKLVNLGFSLFDLKHFLWGNRINRSLIPNSEFLARIFKCMQCAASHDVVQISIERTKEKGDFRSRIQDCNSNDSSRIIFCVISPGGDALWLPGLAARHKQHVLTSCHATFLIAQFFFSQNKKDKNVHNTPAVMIACINCKNGAILALLTVCVCEENLYFLLLTKQD